MDPITWIAAGTALLGALNGGNKGASGGGGGANIMSGAPVRLNQDIDFSGFTVGTGSSKVTGAPNNKTTNNGDGAPAESLMAGGWENMLPVLIVGGAAVLGLLWKR
ncbi:MAG: hypothetical protein V4706_14720 [Pseudomonadota bacterium]